MEGETRKEPEREETSTRQSSITGRTGILPTGEANPTQRDPRVKRKDRSISPMQCSQIPDPTNQGEPFLTYKKTFKPKSAPPPPIIPTQNQFSLLAQPDPPPGTSQTTQQETDTTKDPETVTQTENPSRPKIGQFKIDIDSLFNPNELVKDLMTHCNGLLTAKCTATQLLVTPKTVLAHTKIRDRLDQIRTTNLKDLFFHHVSYHYNRATEELREKLVIKGLPPKYSADALKDNLNELNIKCFHISEMQKRNDNGLLTPLGIFIIEIPRRDMTDIKQRLRYIGHYSIKTENFRQTDRIPQCKNCQKLYHTRTYCRRQTICAFCSLNHPTESCPSLLPSQNENFTPKCHNCHQNHPAFDPNCPYITQARNLRAQQLSKSLPTPTFSPTPNSFPALRKQDKSYATATLDLPTTSESPNTPSTSSQDLKDLLTLIQSCDLKKLLSSIKPIISILKGPGDVLSKLLQAAIKLVEIFN